jgi:predicted O-linked N-acetylglucosamine transferase (SPINDLY family)
MKQIGLDDFVVSDWNTYVDFAVHLGQSETQISDYKERMQAQRTVSALFNPEQFALQFGKALQLACKA